VFLSVMGFLLSFTGQLPPSVRVGVSGVRSFVAREKPPKGRRPSEM
jgi:hypothetical protein